MSSSEKSEMPFEALNGRKPSVVDNHGIIAVLDLKDADEALDFLSNHPRAAEIAIEGKAILDDPVELRRLVRKIDTTIAPLLAAVYFLQFLDKTTLSYTAVMGIRTDTNLVGQDYSNLSMLFYIGMILAGVMLLMLTSASSGRLPRGRVPNPIPCAARFTPSSLPGDQHHALGCRASLSRCMYDVCRISRLSNFAWCLRELCCPNPRVDYCHVVQERGARASRFLVLRLQLNHANFRGTPGLWRQLCTYEICKLEDFLPGNCSTDYNNWSPRLYISS
jgi:hypothetical protein